MFLLDNRTLLVVQIIMGLLSAVYSFFPSGKRHSGVIRLFQGANIAYLLGFSLLLFQGVLPTWITIIIANQFILLGFCLFAMTSVELFHKRISSKFLFVFMAIQLLLFLFFTYIRANTFLRIMIISSEIILFFGFSLLKLRELQPIGQRRVFRIFWFIQGGYIFFVLFRMILTYVLHHQIQSIFSVDRATSIIFLSTIVYHISINLAVILTLAWAKEEQIQEHIHLLEHTHQDFLILNRFSFHSQSNVNLDELYKGIGQYLLDHFNASSVGIFLKDTDGPKLNLVYYQDFPEEIAQTFQEIPLNTESMTGKSILENTPIVLEIEDYPPSYTKRILVEQGIQRMAFYPISSAMGVLGSIIMGFAKGTDILDREKAFFYLACQQMGGILENALLYKSIHNVAMTDPLTGILNRRELMNQLKQGYSRSQRTHRSYSLLLLDLDHFKRINDKYGHDTGDFVLKELVRLILQDLREEDSFGRYGGEEFIVLLDEIPLESALELAERLRIKVENHVFKFQEKEIHITVSLGVSVLMRGDKNPNALITRADQALYKAKEGGRNRSEVM